jgi:3' terminal RNA ribose 2'-O-methyltransferase Hen1
MLLTLTTTHSPATDLGFLLHKNPARLQSFELSFGKVHVFYPEASSQRCTAALLLDIDPVGLVRNRRGPAGEGFALEQYVNDRPYVASSFLSVAISQVFGSALAGTSRERGELAKTPIPLTATLSVLPARGGEMFLRKLFEPLGYAVATRSHVLDEKFPEWGDAPYFTVELAQTITLSELLTHLYVLVPVLDNDKHYWIGEDEVEKLLRHGDLWLAAHPQKEQIVLRYLKNRRYLADQALARLIEMDPDEAEQLTEEQTSEEEQVEKKISLNEQRQNTVLSVLKSCGAKRVLDLGCSYGNLLRRLLEDKQFEEIVGLDVSHRALEIAAERLRLDRLPDRQRQRIRLMHGSLIYRDQRLAGFDAAAVVEVIEHLDQPRLNAFDRVLFEFAKPETVIVTTPNVEFNVRFETLPAGKFRHRDHRYEWTREQFQTWASTTAQRFGYAVRFLPVGVDDPEVGPPTQMAVFTKVVETAQR